MFLSNGIEHLLSTEGQRGNEEEEQEEDRVNDDSSDGNDGNNMYSDSLFTGVKGQSTSVTASGPGTRASGPGTRASAPGTRATWSEKSLLPQGTLAKMRDLMVSTDKVASMLRTGDDTDNNESSYTSYQHTHCQHALSTHPINTPKLYILSTLPINTPYHTPPFL